MKINKIGLRVGHSKNCIGATGYCNEFLESEILYHELEKIFKRRGKEVICCNSSANTEAKELNEGTSKANKNNVDIYITLHMNSFHQESANGVEVWTISDKTDCYSEAKKVVSEIASLGFYNRGVKFSRGLHDLTGSNMTAMVIETCFVSSKKDVDNFWQVGHKKIAEKIADGLLGKEEIQETKNHYTVQCGYFSEKKNAMSLKEELISKGFNCFIKEVE